MNKAVRAWSDGRTRAVLVSVALVITLFISFALPRPRYQGLDVIPVLKVPYEIGEWRGEDVKHDIKLMDEQYNFIKALFLRRYVHPDGQIVYLYLIDAGNFHNPKVCLNGAGMAIRDLEDVELAFSNKQGAQARAFFISRNKEAFGSLVLYWMTINGQPVSWGEQKLKELWFSLLGAKKAGLMARVDIPTSSSNLAPALDQGKQFIHLLSRSLSAHDRAYIFGQ